MVSDFPMSALGMVETKGLVASIEAADAQGTHWKITSHNISPFWNCSNH